MELYNLYTILALTGSMMAVLYMLFHMYMRDKKSHYDIELKKAELEMMRKSLENKIYDVNDRLLSSEDRWRDINHLLIEAQKSNQLPGSEHNFKTNPFFKSMGVTFDKSTTNNSKKKVFVLTPFHERYEKTFYAIKMVCEKAGLNCSRGDEEFHQGSILKHILEEISKSSIVIANIDGRNPNVYYELGLVHALGKQVILITSNISEVPFDVQSQRIIVYKDLNDLQQQLNSALTNAVVKNG